MSRQRLTFSQRFFVGRLAHIVHVIVVAVVGHVRPLLDELLSQKKTFVETRLSADGRFQNRGRSARLRTQKFLALHNWGRDRRR